MFFTKIRRKDFAHPCRSNSRVLSESIVLHTESFCKALRLSFEKGLPGRILKFVPVTPTKDYWWYYSGVDSRNFTYIFTMFLVNEFGSTKFINLACK